VPGGTFNTNNTDDPAHLPRGVLLTRDRGTHSGQWCPARDVFGL
jgi:hypothetical protein